VISDNRLEEGHRDDRHAQIDPARLLQEQFA